VGTLTEDDGAHAAAVKLDVQHSVVTADGWPFSSPIVPPEGAGALDGAADFQGNIHLTGWWKKTGADPSQVMNLTVDMQGYLVGGMKIENKPDTGDNAGLGVTHLGDGTVVVAASVTSGPEDHDIWLRRYPDKPLIVFKGSYGHLDEPRRVRANALDQLLVVGFETVKALQDGKLVPVRRAWMRAFN
jgi:hypothetical protein